MYKHIVTISGGLTSAYVAKLVLEKESDVELIFTDTGWEHPDLFRFLDDLENKVYFRKITRLKHPKFKNPEELFEQQKMLASNQRPICSSILKVKVLQKYLKQKYKNKCVVYFGIDHSEQHRSIRIKERYDKLGIETRFPLVELKEFFIRDKIEKWLSKNNIEIPFLYKLGFGHNNCGGGCVRSGKSSWIKCLKYQQETFRERERVENQFMNGKYSFNKNFRLSQLRESENIDSLFDDEIQCICFE